MKVLTKAIKIQMNQKVMSQKMKNKIKKTLQQSVLLLLLKGNSVDKYLRQNYLLLLIVGQVIKTAYNTANTATTSTASTNTNTTDTKYN